MLPTINGYSDGQTLSIYHKGPRRLNPITIKHWEALEGVIKVEETDYCVEISKSPNFEWYQVFHPELYIPNWQTKKD